MIIIAKPQRHEKPSLLVMYEPDEQGRCVPLYKKAEFDDLIDEYYMQREIELERLQGLLLSQSISPISFFMEYHRMDVKDVAARMRLRAATVRKHLTPAGFEKIDIGTLRDYARVFDVSVCDFFQFTYVPENVKVEVDTHNDRLLQKVVINADG